MFIQKQIENQIGILTIDRPKALNTMNPDVLREMDQSVKDYIADENVGVIILTGVGEKAFIAGADIKVMQQLDRKGALDFGKLGQEITMTIEDSPKPVIAAVNGYALGGGCEISLACHIRFASENAKFGQPEVKLGLIPGWGGTQRLPRIVGKGIATELIIGNTPSATRFFTSDNDHAPPGELKVNVALLPAASRIVPLFRANELVAL